MSPLLMVAMCLFLVKTSQWLCTFLETLAQRSPSLWRVCCHCPNSTATGNSVFVRGIEMGFTNVPLHTIQLDSDLICDTVVCGRSSFFANPRC